MGAAIMAALYARDAAKETKRGADEARRSADEAERSNNAYVARERGHLAIGFCYWRNGNGEGEWPGLTFEVNSVGSAPVLIVGQQWQLLQGPIWPQMDRLQFESWPRKRVEPSDAGDEIFVRLDPPSADGAPYWLIGWFEYETVGASGFRKYFCLKLDIQVHIPLEQQTWFASHAACADMPADT